MKTITAVFLLLASMSTAIHAQTARKLKIVLDVRGDDQAAVGRTMADLRRELQAIGDVELVPPGDSPRTIRVIVAAGSGFYAVSVLVTERYDRETLMVLGIEDDDTANRMMSLQIVNDHQMVTGSDAADLAKRIVASLNSGILARLRR